MFNSTQLTSEEPHGILFSTRQMQKSLASWFQGHQSALSWSYLQTHRNVAALSLLQKSGLCTHAQTNPHTLCLCKWYVCAFMVRRLKAALVPSWRTLACVSLWAGNGLYSSVSFPLTKQNISSWAKYLICIIVNFIQMHNVSLHNIPANLSASDLMRRRKGILKSASLHICRHSKGSGRQNTPAVWICYYW